jgi:hypothetical protein
MEEEEVITDHIIADQIAIGQLFTDQEFRQVAMDAFLAKYNEADTIPPFNCSDGFISDFKEQNHFSSRRAHDKRRPTSDPAIVDQWLAEIRELLIIAPLNRIVNCDKSQWNIHSHGLRTWAIAGSDSVAVRIAGNERDSFTTFCSVTVSQEKLLMMLIALGKTGCVMLCCAVLSRAEQSRAEQSQLGEISLHVRVHTKNGWITTATFQDYLVCLRHQFPDNKSIFLLLDRDSVHRKTETKRCAEDLEIILKFIPAGMTGTFQPLDRSIFGAMKAAYRRRDRLHFPHPGSLQLTK